MLSKWMVLPVLLVASGQAFSWSFSPQKEAKEAGMFLGMANNAARISTTCTNSLFSGAKDGETKSCTISCNNGTNSRTIKIRKANGVNFKHVGLTRKKIKAKYQVCK